MKLSKFSLLLVYSFLTFMICCADCLDCNGVFEERAPNVLSIIEYMNNSVFNENEYSNSHIQSAYDTIKLSDVYLDVSNVKYIDSPDDFRKNIYCRLILFKDSIAVVTYSQDWMQSSTSTYLLSKNIIQHVYIMIKDIISAKVEPLRGTSQIIPYKLSGSLAIYPITPTKNNKFNTESGKLVDSLYTFLSRLPAEFSKKEPTRTLENCIIEITQPKNHKNIEKTHSITADFGADKIMIEGDSISYYDVMRRKKTANLSYSDKQTIFSLFDEEEYVYNNSISPDILYETASDYTLLINDIVHFLHIFPGEPSIELSNHDFLPRNKYILKMYQLYQIVQKYFPVLRNDHFRITDNGKVLRYR